MRGEEAGEARRVECFFSQYHNSTLANSTLATQRSDGVLFIDHISRLKRDMIVRRFMKEMRQSGSGSPKGE